MDPLPDLPPKQNVSPCGLYQSISDPVYPPRPAIFGRYTEKSLASLAAVHFLLCVAMLRGLMLSGFWLRCFVLILLIEAKHVAAVRTGDGGDSTIQTALPMLAGMATAAATLIATAVTAQTTQQTAAIDPADAAAGPGAPRARAASSSSSSSS